jgi:hypothetical protein
MRKGGNTFFKENFGFAEKLIIAKSVKKNEVS